MASESGSCTDRTGHDYRRVFLGDINPEHDAANTVLAVCCCRCGRSPLHAMRRGLKVNSTPKKDWPEDLRITAYFTDADDGPSVEFEKR